MKFLMTYEPAVKAPPTPEKMAKRQRMRGSGMRKCFRTCAMT